MWWFMALVPAFKRQMDIYEFEASLVYLPSSSTTRATLKRERERKREKEREREGEREGEGGGGGEGEGERAPDPGIFAN